MQSLPDFLLSCNKFLNCLQKRNYSFEEGSLWKFADFSKFVVSLYPKFINTFTDMFKCYCLFAGGMEFFSTLNHYSLEQLILFDSLKATNLKRQFITILLLILFSRSHKCHGQLDALMFLLHYRGLSYTGLNLFSQMGFFVSPRSFKVHFDEFVDTLLPLPSAVSIFWFDNLVRQIKGFREESIKDSHTVLGVISLPIAPLKYCYEKPAIGDIFSPEAMQELQNMFVGCSSESIIDISDELWEMDVLTVPLTCKKEYSYNFREVDVLPIICGTGVGTSEIIDYLRSALNVYSENVYVFLLLDYDLYWRVHKFIWSDSFLRNSLHTFRKRRLLLHAPWHIYKLLADSVWKTFAPLFLADLWLYNTEQTNSCPRKPELKFYLFYYIAIWAIIKDRIQQQDGCPEVLCMGNCYTLQ